MIFITRNIIKAAVVIAAFIMFLQSKPCSVLVNLKLNVGMAL